MRTFTAIIERCFVTGQYVGHVPALPGAHTHADTLDQLHHNLVEVVTLVLEDQDCEPETEFVGTHTIHVEPPCPAYARRGHARSSRSSSAG